MTRKHPHTTIMDDALPPNASGAEPSIPNRRKHPRPKSVPPISTDPSIADIRALLQAERKQRAEACLKEIQAAIQPLLKKYQCESRIVSEWVIVPLDPS